jgi:hypothetical protein
MIFPAGGLESGVIKVLGGVNRAESAVLEKVCKTASFFAAYPEMEPPDGQTGAVDGPD